MESLQQFSNESFSYSWVINIKPSFDSLDNDARCDSFDTQDSGSFIEMDLDFFSMRWTSDAHDFDFSLPSSQASVLVHADEIFSDGVILPLHLVTPPESEVVSDASDSVLSRSLSLDSSKTVISQSNRYRSHCLHDVPSGLISSNSSPIFHTALSTPFSTSSYSLKSSPSRNLKLKLPFLGNCVRSPKKILGKYLFFLTPLYKKVKGLRLSSTKSVRSGDSASTSPRTSNAFSSIEWCRGRTIFDMSAENKIYDAVLHCKKSIGQH